MLPLWRNANILNTQNVAYQQNKLYFRIVKIKAEIKKQPLSHLISACKNHFIWTIKRNTGSGASCIAVRKNNGFRRITRIMEIILNERAVRTLANFLQKSFCHVINFCNFSLWGYSGNYFNVVFGHYKCNAFIVIFLIFRLLYRIRVKLGCKEWGYDAEGK